MIQLNYTLLEEEAIRYFEMILRSTKETRLPRIIAMLWGPALAILFMILFKATASLVGSIIAIAFSLVWIFILCPRFYREVCHLSAKRKLAENKSVMHPIHLMEEAGRLVVNKEEKRPKDYFIYYDLLVIGFDDGTNLIVPERVFNKNEKQIEQLIKDIALMLKSEN